MTVNKIHILTYEDYKIYEKSCEFIDEDDIDNFEDINFYIYWSIINKDKLKIGDLIKYIDSYRGNSVYIYTEIGIEHILQDNAAYSFIIPRIINLNLKNGYSLKEIIYFYKEHVNIIIYPLEYQNNFIKLYDDNKLKQVYGYNCDENYEGILDTDLGISDFTYYDIFKDSYELID
jgi:hypothetical protein